eukprot:scaffold21458_cov167-Amphora_coffeaeformis.AAC.6
MKAMRLLSLLLAGALFSPAAFSFAPPRTPTARPSFSLRADEKDAASADEMLPTNQAVQRVAVAGATGRVGQCVVQELLDRKVDSVVALVRSQQKAKETWGLSPPANLKIIECDLTDTKALKEALKDVDAAVWCATGFSQSTNLVERLKSLFGLATQQPSIDTVGLPLLTQALPVVSQASYPRITMCSSAGVTRPKWNDNKKEKLVGAADIPIVRLNPFGILDIKFESEETLRRAAGQSTGIPYCIVRPSGLNDSWPAGSRPIVSQGDVSVGRINRKDVAKVLVDVLSIPEAVDKTFEVMTVADYPPPRSLRPALRRLSADGDAVSEAMVEATYHVMQQLLPGEKQAANELAMGQTYEQLDKGETGRLGPRGQEKAVQAAPQPTSGTTR